MSPSPEFRFILDTVLPAGRLAMTHFRAAAPAAPAHAPAASAPLASPSPAYVTKSSPFDLVTAADREVEAFVVDAIRRAFPGDPILAEESAADFPGGLDAVAAAPPPRLWVLDPIDGTTNFAHGFPQFAVSLAFYEGAHGPTAAAVYNPATDELFAACRGAGATLNGRPLRVGEVDDVARALLATGYAYDRRERIDYYLAVTRRILMNAHGVRRLGSAALDLCWVAAGRLDAHVECRLQPWDMAAGRLVVEEAGGCVTDFRGRPIGRAAPAGRATNPRLLPSLVALFSPLAGGAMPVD